MGPIQQSTSTHSAAADPDGRNRPQAVYYAVTRLLAGAESFDQLAPKLLELLVTSLGCEAATIWLADRTRATLRCRYFWSVPSLAGNFREASERLELRLEEGLPGNVWTTATAYWIPDLSNDPHFMRVEAASAAGLRSAFALPIVDSGDPQGVLELFACNSNEPHRELVEMLTHVCTQIALSMDRERIVRALQRSEEQYRRLARLFEDAQGFAHVGSFELDLADRRSRCSDELYRMIGLEPQSRALNFDAGIGLVVPDEREAVRNAVLMAIEHRQTLDLRCRIHRRDGVERVIRARACVIGERPDTMRFVGAVLDITEDERALAERFHLQRELDETKRLSSLGSLAATMAHEFNNVLMGIDSFASFLVRRKHDPETQNAAQHIQQSLKRGRTITDEILRFTRASAPVMHVVDVGRWLVEFMAEAEAVTNGRARFHFPEESLFVHGDVSQLNQVLSNLIVNARDASPPDAPITISARRATQELAGTSTPCVALTVADEGSGIPEELRDRIFEPLFTTKRRGTGLGLAVVHQVVRAHGGVVRLRSEVGVGTEFHVVLPLLDKALASRERHGVARVAVIDDEELVADALSELLALEGIEAIAITDPREIAARVEAFRPEAIVIDHQMWEAAGELRGVPLVVMASRPESPVSEPDVVYLRKPFDAQQLLAALAKLGRGRS